MLIRVTSVSLKLLLSTGATWLKENHAFMQMTGNLKSQYINSLSRTISTTQTDIN